MYQMMTSLGVRAAVRRELPAGLIAFLATWWVPSWFGRALTRMLEPKGDEHARKIA
jgi:hypothetical protein